MASQARRTRIAQAKLVEHISNAYNAADILTFEGDTIEKGIAANASVRNYFNFFLAKLPRPLRTQALEERSRAMGLERALADFPDAIQLFGDKNAPDGRYANFSIPRSKFVGEQSVDALTGRLAYATLNLQVDEAIEGAARFTMPGKLYTDEFVRTQAAHMAKSASTGKSFLEGASRLVVDVETSGLGDHANIWQISARLMGKDGVPDRVEDILLPKSMVGLFGDPSNPLPFEEFYEQLRGGQIKWTDDVAEGLTRLFSLAEDADYIIGQNIAFDAGALERLIEVHKHTNPDFAKAATGFLGKVHSGAIVDTAFMSRALLGGEGIVPAMGLTPYSMENILSQTSFLDDLAERLGQSYGAGDDFVDAATRKAAGGHGGRAAIMGRIKAGMHLGDVDTWFEDHLAVMQGDIFGGKKEHQGLFRALGKKGLDPTGWGDAEFWGLDPEGKAYSIRSAISRAAAITPTTDLEGLGTTPLLNLVDHTRRFDTGDIFMGQLQEKGVVDSRFFKAGMFEEYAAKVLRRDGSIKHGVTLTEPDFARIDGLHTVGEVLETLQERAMKAKLPYAGISSIDRLFTTLLGTASNKDALGGVNSVRKLVGDIIGSAAISMSEKVAIHGRDKNLALPMKLIEELERAEIINTKFHEVASGTTQGVRWSPFSYGIDGGKDFALVSDMFENVTDKNWTQFLDFLEGNRGEYGITDDIIDTVRMSRSNIQKFGVQIGVTMGGDDSLIAQAYTLAEQYGLTRDKSGNMRLWTTFLGLPEALKDIPVEEGRGLAFTGATFLGDRDGSVLVERASEISRENRLVRAMLPSALNDLPQDSMAMRGIKSAKMFGDRKTMPIYRFLEKNFENLPRRAGYAGLGLAAYYMFRKSRENDVHDETFEMGGYEDPSFYEQYKEEMGEQAPSNYMELHQERRQLEALATAGVVGSLDRNKIGHHAMGPNKHNHLFGG